MTKLNKLISLCMAVMMLSALLVVPVGAAETTMNLGEEIQLPYNTDYISGNYTSLDDDKEAVYNSTTSGNAAAGAEYIYKINVGDDSVQGVKEAGLYALELDYITTISSKMMLVAVAYGDAAPTEDIGYNWIGGWLDTECVEACADDSTVNTTPTKVYVQLKEGNNYIKIMSWHSSIYLKMPRLHKVNGGNVVVEEMLNKYNYGEYTYKLASNCENYQYYGFSRLRYAASSGGGQNYITIPVTVPKTADYKLEISAGADQTFKLYVDYNTNVDSLTTSFSKSKLSVTGLTTTAASFSSKFEFKTVNESVQLAANTTYYFRIFPRTNAYDVSAISRLRLTHDCDCVAEMAEDGLNTTISVQDCFYDEGDMIIAATYNSAGRLTGAEIKQVTEFTDTTDITVTKSSAEDTVKVMIWDDLTNRNPRVAPITPVTVTQ